MINDLGLKREVINQEDYYRFKRMVSKWKHSIKEANAKNIETVKNAWEHFKKYLFDWGYNVSLRDNWVNHIFNSTIKRKK